ncbi:MAG: phytanoyl-CoA dioxygenase family protein [Planctomycetota bacterium]
MQDNVTNEALRRDGYAVVKNVVDAGEVSRLRQALSLRNHRRANLRNVFSAVPESVRVLRHPGVRACIRASLGTNAFAVRAILFDKTADANWLVAWHQDTAIPIQEPLDTAQLPPGYGPQSVKDGVPHCRASENLLADMLTLRLHLDDCGEENGPLRVIPGSHALGRLEDHKIENARRQTEPVSVLAAAGDALLMRPLTLHASSQSDRPGHRRVLHVEFAHKQLPEPLRWHERQYLFHPGFPR